jgi:hypothetical protein
MEARVWEAISGILNHPEQLRADLERMIELERQGMRGDPERQVKTWLDKLAEADRQRARAQDLAIEGLLSHEELRAKLAALDETRAIAERELEAFKGRREYLEDLERDKDTLLETYATLAPEALDSLAPEERHKLYKILRLRAVVGLDGTLELGDILVEDLRVCSVEAIP